MDSRASEQPWATGRSSGAKLLVDERLLARASSCTNMIPGERGRKRGGRGRGKRARKAVVQQLGSVLQVTGLAPGNGQIPQC